MGDVQTFGREKDPAKRIRKARGDKLRSTRELQGIEIHELADKLGVTVGAISHWETGRYTPRPHHQVAIAAALNVPWVVLFGLDAA